MKTAKTQKPQVGMNRTGTGAAPERAEQMIEGMEEFPPTSSGLDGPAETRIQYASEGFRPGSIPETGAGGLKVKPKLAPLLDKLGARLAFERAGTRLYDALLSKHDAYGGFDGGPSREELEDKRDEEHEHMLLCQRVIADLGGDPTAVTPCANLQLTMSMGVPAVITEARTTLLESLEAVLVAELADRESWQALIDVATELGQTGPAEEFRAALETEEEHLADVRRWVAAGQRIA